MYKCGTYLDETWIEKRMSATKRVLSLTLCVLPAALSISVRAQSQTVPTSNVTARTRLVQFDDHDATAFTIDVDGKQYLVTAKHFVSSADDGAKITIQMWKRNGWDKLEVTVFKCSDPVDIAVLVPPKQVSVNFALPPDHAGDFVGEDVYFVGFPFGTEHAITYPTMAGVFGVVKRATIAQLEYLPAENVQRLWLDGINNEGFSGSPVVFYGPGQSEVGSGQSKTVLKVAGVISAYEPQITAVYDKTEIKAEDITPADREQNVIGVIDGKIYRLKDTGRVVQSNTGLAIAWDISPAVELIRKHPIGPAVTDGFDDAKNGY